MMRSQTNYEKERKKNKQINVAIRSDYFDFTNLTVNIIYAFKTQAAYGSNRPKSQWVHLTTKYKWIIFRCSQYRSSQRIILRRHEIVTWADLAHNKRCTRAILTAALGASGEHGFYWMLSITDPPMPAAKEQNRGNGSE